MRIPNLSHLQIVVLGLLKDAERRGAVLRDALGGLNIVQTGPSFYQMMARLEDAGLAEGWYSQRVVEGQLVKERHYRITKAGRRELRDAQMFYAHVFKPALEGRTGG